VPAEFLRSELRRLLGIILEYLDKTMTTSAGADFCTVADIVRQPILAPRCWNTNPLTARQTNPKTSAA
jgi:hypothetical protein